MQVCFAMYDLLFHPARKGRELNICKTKNWETNKSCELDFQKSKNCGKIANEQIFIAFIYLLVDFILLWNKITHIKSRKIAYC